MEKVCTHVAIIQKGVLKAVGAVHEVMNVKTGSSVTKMLVTVGAANNDQLKTVLLQMPGIESISLEDNDLQVICDEHITTEKINQYCFDKGLVLNKLILKKKSLETRFLEITGKQSDR